jgi:hypothetical protein
MHCHMAKENYSTGGIDRRNLAYQIWSTMTRVGQPDIERPGGQDREQND